MIHIDNILETPKILQIMLSLELPSIKKSQAPPFTHRFFSGAEMFCGVGELLYVHYWDCNAHYLDCNVYKITYILLAYYCVTAKS